ncbi:DUF3592 domain-containing protein [Streptomyces sp. NPDC018833]|uniref:DUF3592 domain-containing protein n=1 Tax=Streptomyces sp. NPDC018833 TaxID=3365053 RepID=UPI0037889ADF
MDALVSIVLVTATTAAAVHLLHRSWRSWRLIRHGVRTTGRVVHVREDTDGDGDPTYIPVIAFHTAEGTEREAEPTDGVPNGHLLRPGQEWQIRYHPASPSKIYIDNYDSRVIEVLWGLAGLTLLGVDATILGQTLR